MKENLIKLNKVKKGELCKVASQSSSEFKMYSTTAVQHYKFLNHVTEDGRRVNLFKHGKLDFDAIM